MFSKLGIPISENDFANFQKNKLYIFLNSQIQNNLMKKKIPKGTKFEQFRCRI